MINKINEIIDEKEQFQLQALRLETENKRLKEEIDRLTFNKQQQYPLCYTCTDGNCVANKTKTYLRILLEIKEIAEQSNVDCIYRISVIRKILTKAESEE